MRLLTNMKPARLTCWTFLLGGMACAQSEPFSADLILVNGKILTVDATDTVAEAVAIKHGTIVAVGTTDEIEQTAVASTRRIDLAGKTATPGLIDSHAHISVGAPGDPSYLDLSYPNVESVADVVQKVAERVAELQPSEWVRGGNWDEGKLEERRYIYAEDLDPVTPDNPAWLSHTTAHYGVANSLALELSGITRETPDPEGGLIDRHPDGTPTGVLKDTAMGLIHRRGSGSSGEDTQTGLERFFPMFAQEGMTAIKDPQIRQETWDAYQRLRDEGKLTARVFVLWRAGRTVEEAEQLIEQVGSFTNPRESTGDDLLISGGIKVYIDGSGGARTAWMHDEWNKNLTDIDSDNYGLPRTDPEILRRIIKTFHNAGLHVGTHAIGDRAIDWTVDTYAQAMEENPIRGLRHSIIHCNIPTDHALEQMQMLQQTYDAGYPELQAGFTWWIGDTYAGNFGSDRNLLLKPLRSFLERGIRWGGGSDYDVTPFPARYGLWASVARESLMGAYGATPFGRVEAVDIMTALRSYTIWNAHQLFLDDKIGSIEVGKYTDIAVWDRDLTSVPVAEIKELQSELTLLAGKIVYKAPDTDITVEGAGH